MASDIPSLAPQWIKRGASLNNGAASKLVVEQHPGDQKDTRPRPEERASKYELNNYGSRGTQQQLRPANSSPWASTTKPAQQHTRPNQESTAAQQTPRFTQTAERNSRREVPVRVHDLLTAADPLGARVIEVYRTASVPPPTSVPFPGAGHPKATFDAEFPSLRDAAPAGPPLGGVPEASQVVGPPPASKQTPYRPSYLSDRVNTNWTSKLADAPTPAPREPSPPPPDPPTAPAPPTSPPAPQPEPAPPLAPPVTQASGWVSLANGHAGDGGRPKLLETLSGTATAGSQQSSTNEAGTFRAQLAVRQSKQLIPVLARKGDKPGDGGSGGNGGGGNGSKAAPAGVTPGRNTLMGTVAMLRQTSSGATAAAAASAVQGGVGPDGKLQLRPLTRRMTTSGAAADEAGGSGGSTARAPNGMMALCRSPPPAAKKLAAVVTDQEHTSNGSPISGAGQCEARKQQTPASAAQPTATEAAKQPAVASPLMPHQEQEQPAATQPAAPHRLLSGSNGVLLPPPGFGSTPQEHTDVSSILSPVRTSTAGNPTSEGQRVQPFSADAANPRTSGMRSMPSKSVPGSEQASAVVPADELAFLVSLGWTGEEEDEAEGDALTEEEIAAFRAASAQLGGSRCSTPQLRFSAPTSRTTSPAPFYPSATAAAAAVAVSSPGYTRTVATANSRNMRGQSAPFDSKVAAAAGGGGNGACQVVVEVEPLFPGVSPGWFGGLAVASGSPGSFVGSRGSQDGLSADVA